MKKVAMFIISLLVVLLSGCSLVNHQLADKMIEKYSQDQNYVHLSGEVIEIRENNLVIKCEELDEYLSYEDEFCDYYIYADEIIELPVGTQLDFMTVPYHFYNGHKLPIVEVAVGGNIMLTFYEGKENLIDWVNTNFK